MSITSEPLQCPKCDADLGEYGKSGLFETDYNVAWRSAGCEKCGCGWTEHYSFETIIFDEPDDEKIIELEIMNRAQTPRINR